jgi:hypothetical protein
MVLQAKQLGGRYFVYFWSFLYVSKAMVPIRELQIFLYCLDLMDQRFLPAKNNSTMLTLLKHAYSTRLKSGRHAKIPLP